MFALETPKVPENSIKTILLIEDDRMVSNLIKSFLEKSDFLVHQVFRGDLAREALIKYQPDLIILDIGLPNMDGFDVCHQLREVYANPIVMLTARENDEAQINAFNLGADDYIVKPVSPAVLKVRVEAMLRRNSSTITLPLHAFRVGNVALFPQANKCEVNGKELGLSSFEFQLLALLLRNVGRVMTRDAIYSVLLAREYNGVERTVDVRMSKLRDKLHQHEMSCVRIETVWGKGYILNETAC